MQLDEHGNYAVRKLEDGRTLCVIALTYGRARLCVGNRYMPLCFNAAY